MTWAIELAERRLVPDRAIRMGIRSLLRKRLAAEAGRAAREGANIEWTRAMSRSPVAVATDAANRQHYEVPVAFYEKVLGSHLKYSAAYFPEGGEDLSAAEAHMLQLTCERARLEDGQRILELGCGWGSLTLWMAEHYPNSRILAVSNSSSQREWIQMRAEERGLENVRVITVDVNVLNTDDAFDRVVSVEMFEHVRNWEALLDRIHGWLKPDGNVFLHFFAHAQFAYPFETTADDDWMGRHFFTGGMMPAADMLERLDIPFDLDARWNESGMHYSLTAEAWLRNLDRHEGELLRVLAREYGADAATRQLQRWRMFFLACAELFGFSGGSEWLVTHALLSPALRKARR